MILRNMIGLFILMLLIKNILGVGIIWNENEKDFKQIFNISTFKIMKERYIEKINKLENHNFCKESIKIGYYQVI